MLVTDAVATTLTKLRKLDCWIARAAIADTKRAFWI